MSRLLTVAIIPFLAACTQAPSPDAATQQRITALEQQVAQQQTDLANQQADLTKLEQQVGRDEVNETTTGNLATTALQLVVNPFDEYAELDATETGYGTCKINGGEVLIAINKVEPYLTGMKVYLAIGNPLASALTGVKATVFYGSALDKGTLSETWRKTAKNVTQVFNDDIHGGAWTDEEVILPSCDASTCQHLSINLENSGMKLSTPAPVPSPPQ